MIAAFTRSQQYVIQKPVGTNGANLWRLHRQGREGQMVLVEVGSVKITGGAFALRIWVNGRQLKDERRFAATLLAALDIEHDSYDEA